MKSFTATNPFRLFTRPFVAILALALLLAHVSHAASPPSPARPEINALLSKLETSGCRFNRNGNWYSGLEAKAHLLRKLDYLEGKGAVQTTEQFIELAASASSSSGTAYQVQCQTAPAQSSAAWLTAQLKALRAGPVPNQPR